MKRTMLPFLLVLMTIGCERNLSGPTINQNGVQITPGSDSMTIANRTDTELRFFLVNQQVLSLILWAPYCLETGLIIPRDGKAIINYEDVYDYEAGCKIVVHWWACHEVEGRRQPGEVQSVVVPSVAD